MLWYDIGVEVVLIESENVVNYNCESRKEGSKK